MSGNVVFETVNHLVACSSHARGANKFKPLQLLVVRAFCLCSDTRDGVDYDMCYKWGITGEQWQDAIFAALKSLSDKR